MNSRATLLHPIAILLMTGLATLLSGCAAGAADMDDADQEGAESDDPAAHGLAATTGIEETGGGGGTTPPPGPAYLQVALKAPNGQYFVAENGGGGTVNANRYAIGAWETFNLVPLGGANFAFQASNGQYVVVEGGAGGTVNANRGAIGAWETFTLENLAGGKTRFHTAGQTTYYLEAWNGGGAYAYSWFTLYGWEKLTMVDVTTAPLSHPLCSVGSALNGKMGSCVTKICAASPQCCSTGWDSTCVTAVTNICAQSC